jgi:hypothetical protein
LSEAEDADFPELIGEDEAAKFLKAKIGIGSPKTLRRMRCTGGGPRFVKVGPYVRYKRADLLDWARSRVSDPIENTSQAPGYRPNTRGRRATAEARA